MTSADTQSSDLQGFADLFGGHFPGHTMQRVRTPDGKYRYNYVSPGVKSAFALDPDDLMNREAVNHEWIHPQDRQRFIDALENSARNLSVLDEEVRVQITEDKYKWVRSIGHPSRLEDGTVIWDGVALDVTDRREAREALERALSQARMDEISEKRFASIAARDVVSPFENLSNVMDELQQALTSNAAQKQLTEATQSAIVAYNRFARTFSAAIGLVNARKDREGIGNQDTASETPATVLENLTRRQRDVFTLLQKGASNREIAEQLGIGEGTVKLHVSAILKTLGVKNRTSAVTLLGF